MKNLKEIRVEKSEYLFFPPILDEDPTFAANFLTVEDSKICYEVMKTVLKELQEKGDSEFVLIKECMYQSTESFYWFLEFFRELERLLEEPEYCTKYIERPENSSEDPIEFYPPIKTEGLVKKGGVFRPIPRNIKLRVNDSINKHRVFYISQAYELTDFRDGLPAWYLLKETTVFEKYDEKTNHRIRIDFKGGEFFYFLCGASDNWQQITEVPLEMDYVVAALLFRD